MDQKIIDRIKQDLLEKRDQLKAELGEFASPDAGTADDYTTKFPDYGDQYDENAQEVSQYTTDIEAERVLENTLKDVEKALTAIDKGGYGICKYCGNEIEEKRLLVRPFSSACVHCKTKLQQG
jgi:RNA polymerase-binding protein DksA